MASCLLLCGSTTPVVPLVVLPYVQCTHCGIVYRDEAESPAKSVTRPPVAYEAFLNYTRDKLAINRERLRWLARRAPHLQPGRAVDIGTKDGSVIKLLTEAGWSAVGFDPDTRFVDFAKMVHGAEIRPELFTKSTVPSGSLDLVTAFHVLEHVRDPWPFLEAIRESLAPHGYLYIEVPNLRYIQARQLMGGHAVLYTAHTLRQVLTNAGFTVQDLTEYAPGGGKTYDQLAVLAQRGEQREAIWSVGIVDRTVPAAFERAAKEPSPSTLLSVRVYRGVKRRIRRFIRKPLYI